MVPIGLSSVDEERFDEERFDVIILASYVRPIFLLYRNFESYRRRTMAALLYSGFVYDSIIVFMFIIVVNLDKTRSVLYPFGNMNTCLNL